jgi:hypothetical protein
MSDFAARMVARATGATGIQPRIAPITAPAPWHEPLDLEWVTRERTVVPADAPAPADAPVPADPSSTIDPRPRRASMPPTESERLVEHARVETSQDVPASEHVAARAETSIPFAARPRDLRVDESTLTEPLRTGAQAGARGVTGSRGATNDVLSVHARSLPTAAAHGAPREEHPTPSIDGADQRGAFEPPTPDPSRPPIVPSFRVRPPALASRPTASRAHPAHEDRSGDLIIEEHRETGRTSLASDPRSTASPEHARSSSIPVASPSSTVLAVDPTHDLPRPPRRRESASEGIVRVEIGRVELRAAPSHETSRSERGVPKPESFVSLNDYLRGRGGT